MFKTARSYNPKFMVPRYYLDPETCTIVGKDASELIWNVIAPAYSGNMEIWSLFDKYNNEFWIEKKAVY